MYGKTRVRPRTVESLEARLLLAGDSVSSRNLVFRPAEDFVLKSGSGVTAATFADLNGDGTPDLITGEQRGSGSRNLSRCV
jgi:hypothetical protein